MNNSIPKHSISKSIALHLLPGILAGICYYAIAPTVISYGFPSVMALALAGVLVLIPFELGFLFYQKKKNGVNAIKKLTKYRNPLKIWQYIIFTFAIVLLSAILFKAFSFASDFLMPLFSWIPNELLLDMGLNGEYSKVNLIITYSIFLVLIVIILPIIEEFYFRGYLLERIPEEFKKGSEIIHSALFALYHIWTPWLFITRTFSVLPLVYIVKRKKNIYIGIIAHCIMNSIDFIVGLVFIMNI